MKGPRARHKFNVLRIWECPQCKKRAFVPPQVVNRTCECQGKDRPTWMCLIEAPPKPKRVIERAPPPPSDPS